MKKVILVFVLFICSQTAIQAQVGAYDTLHFKNTYNNDIFSSFYTANFRSGLMLQSGASINYALNGASANGFRFRWLANDTLVNYTNDNDLIMTLLPKGELIIKSALNVPNLTTGSFTDTSYKKLVIAGANLPTNAGSRRDISYEFSGAGKAIIRAYRGSAWDTYLQFMTSGITNTGGTPVVHMHINQNGNIGLGTVSPSQHLHLSVSTNIDNLIYIKNEGIPNSNFFIGNTSNNYVVTNQRSANLLESYTDLHISAANTGNIYFETARASTVAPVRMTILNNGSVGIGTAVTGTNKLAVEGTVAARKVKVTQASPWPDYVFHDDYYLTSLNDLAMYISEHKHLPGIPDAAQIEKDGQDLGEMNRKLLEKVEELTLYIIQQQKKNEEQQMQIDMLIKKLAE